MQSYRGVGRAWRVLSAAALLVGMCGCPKPQKTVLRVGFSNFRPYVSTTQTQKPEGFAVELIDKAAQKAGVELKWVPIGKSVEEALDGGIIDLYPIITDTPERRSRYHLSTVWWQNELVLLSVTGKKLPPEARIGVRDLPYVRSLVRETLPYANIVKLPLGDLIPELCKGHVDGALIDLRLLQIAELHRSSICEGGSLEINIQPKTHLSLASISTRSAASKADRVFRQLPSLVADGSVAQAASDWAVLTLQPQPLVLDYLESHHNRSIVAVALAAFFALGVLTLMYLRRLLKARRAAEEADKRFEAFMDHAPLVSFYKDAQGRMLYANKEWRQRFGPQVQFPVERDEDIWPEETADLFRETDQRILDGDSQLKVIDRLADHDGRIRDWLTVKFPFRNAVGELLIGGTAIDVTEQQSAYFASLASEEKYRGLFELAPVAIHELDRFGAIARVNQAECALLGYAAEELLGHPIWDFIDPEQQHESQEIFKQRMSGKAPLRPFQRRFLRKDGQQITLEIHHSRIFDAEGEIVGMRGCLVDLTERLSAQAKLDAYARELEDKNEKLAEALQTAQQASLLKNQFLANMSHEIRTPMNGVLGMTELLLTSSLDLEQRDLATTVLQSAEHLLTIINDILDFSKIEAGRIELEAAPFDLRELAESVCEGMGSAASRKGVELICALDENVPDLLVGDQARVRQILTNFVGNAIKFTDIGEVVVGIENLASTSPGQAAIRISVADTGIGIPEEAQSKLFTPFTQADSSTTRKFGGSGLGLAISKKLVELMNGSIGINSAPGQGSIFWFQTNFAVSAGGSNPTADLKGKSLLIVDDNVTNRRYLRSLLESWGARVSEATNGSDALALLRQSPESFSSAILDFHMPDMDGIELASEIHRDPRYAGLQLILLSSFGREMTKDRLELAGLEASLTKPVRRLALARALAPQSASPAVPVRGPKMPMREHAGPLLIAEDNVVNSRLVLRLVQQLGYRADVVPSGKAAVDRCKANRYAAILMDCQMPEMDGYEATKFIRESEGANHTPIIALTAHAMKGDREKCLQAGMDDYVSKPLRLHELATALARWVPQSAEADTTTADLNQAS